ASAGTSREGRCEGPWGVSAAAKVSTPPRVTQRLAAREAAHWTDAGCAAGPWRRLGARHLVTLVSTARARGQRCRAPHVELSTPARTLVRSLRRPTAALRSGQTPRRRRLRYGLPIAVPDTSLRTPRYGLLHLVPQSDPEGRPTSYRSVVPID